MRTLTLPTAVLLALAILAPASAAEPDPWPLHDRLYLLGSEDGFSYWSVDPLDPELGVGRDDRTCEVLGVKGIPGYEVCRFTFFPGTLLTESVGWGSQSPLRFRLALDVATPGAPTVTVSAGDREAQATETAPGIWEATMTSPGALQAETWNLIEVAVTSDHPLVSATLHMDGRSWVDLPSEVRAAGVPRLLAEEKPSPDPVVFDTPFRSFRFHDDDWRVVSMEGDLSETRELQVELDGATPIVLGWVEAWDTPFTHDVVRGKEPDLRKLTEAMETDLFVDGERVDAGGASGVYGVGSDTVAATDVTGAVATLRIEPTPFWPTDVNHDHPYTAYLLVVEGERTLARMRWPSMFGGYPGITATQAPFAAVCPGFPQQPVPVTREVRTFEVSMRADTVGGPTSEWSLAYLLPPNSWFLCGEASTGDAMRFTFPHRGVHMVGATVARDTTYAEWRETVFEWDVRYTYSPPPEPDEEGQAVP